MIQLPNLQTSRVPVLGLSGRRCISPCLMKSLHPSWPYQAKLSQKHWDSWFPFFPAEMHIFIYLSIYFKLKLTLLMELEIVFQGWPLVSIYNLLVTNCMLLSSCYNSSVVCSMACLICNRSILLQCTLMWPLHIPALKIHAGDSACQKPLTEPHTHSPLILPNKQKSPQ